MTEIKIKGLNSLKITRGIQKEIAIRFFVRKKYFFFGKKLYNTNVYALNITYDGSEFKVTVDKSYGYGVNGKLKRIEDW